MIHALVVEDVHLEVLLLGGRLWIVLNVIGDDGHTGRSVDQYTTIQLLGKGTFGTVFLARDETNQQLVAMKKVKLK